MNIKIPTITTPRLTLRAFTEKDVEPLHRILNEKDLLRYFPTTDPPSQERVQKMIANVLTHWEEHGYGLWAVETRAAGELIGRCGLYYIAQTDEIEVDFILSQAFWGRGFATEAGRTSLQYGFADLQKEVIVGIVHPENKASQRVLEKLGLRQPKAAHYFGMDCLRYEIRREWAELTR